MTTTATNPNQLVDSKEAAAILGISPLSLNQWRHEGTHRDLQYVKVGRAVRYRVADIERWIESRTRSCTGDDAATN